MSPCKRLALVAIATASLSGCVETSDGVAPGTPYVSDPNSPAVRACRAAIARQVGVSVRDVSVYDAPGSEAGTRVLATVAGAEAPWSCIADNNGNVAEVMYTGSEGRL